MNKKVVILFNKVSANALTDELDVLNQVQSVEESLKNLGYESERLSFSFQIDKVIANLKKLNPLFVFNLVESVDNKGELCHVAPAVLDSLQIPYSGVPLEGIFVTTNKTLTKKILQLNQLPTAPWFELKDLKNLNKDKTYIIKPTLEDGSLGLEMENVFKGSNNDLLETFRLLPGNKYFIEEYISGREFNVSIMGGRSGPEVLPPAEMLFMNFPEDSPKILGYRAKWDEDCEEYKKTVRTFDIPDTDKNLIKEITNITSACWGLFGLKGYARVDFRVNEKNRPYILEINANPCISPDSGLVAALDQKNYTFDDFISKVIEDIL